MKFKFVLLLLLFFVCFFSSSFAATTISAAFDRFNNTNINAFQLNGNAALSGSVLRLTPASSTQSGSAFWINRISLPNLRSFSTYFVFNISSQGGIAPTGADGFVFVLQNASNSAGTSGGGLGFAGIPNAVGIEFDTWYNAEYGDANGNHIGLDLSVWNGTAYVGNVTSVANVSDPNGYTNFGDSGNYSVWIDYDGQNNNLSVRINKNNATRPADPVLTTTINLTSSNLGQENYVGFTAATGGAWENHDILSFYFNYDYIPEGITPSNTSYVSAPNDLNLTTTDASIQTGGYNTTITAIIYDETGSALGSGIPINFTTTAGTLSSSGATTNSSGQVSVTLTSSSTDQNVTVRANTTGGAFEDIVIRFYDDLDGDSVSDDIDNLFGQIDNVNSTGFSNLNITVSGNSTNGSYDDVHEVIIYDGSVRVANFTHNFTSTNLNLTNMTLIKSTNYVIVNLSGQLQSNNYRKTLYLPDNGFVSICVKDATISSIDEMSANCTGTNETDFSSCIGSNSTVTIGNLSCALENGTFRIWNLSHSSVRGIPSNLSSSSPSSGSDLKSLSLDIGSLICPSNDLVLVLTSRGTPVSRVMVRVVLNDPYEGNLFTGESDSNGQIQLNIPHAGSYDFYASKSGYRRIGPTSRYLDLCSSPISVNASALVNDSDLIEDSVAPPVVLDSLVPDSALPPLPSPEPSVSSNLNLPSSGSTSTASSAPSSEPKPTKEQSDISSIFVSICLPVIVFICLVGVIVFFWKYRRKKRD